MKASLFFSLLFLTSSGYAANAAQTTAADYSDIDVVSVTPRSPEVKPLVMAIYSKEQRQRVAAALKNSKDPVQKR